MNHREILTGIENLLAEERFFRQLRDGSLLHPEEGQAKPVTSREENQVTKHARSGDQNPAKRQGHPILRCCDTPLILNLHEVSLAVESGLSMIGVGIAHLLRTDEREKFPGSRFVEIVILIEPRLTIDLEALDELIPAVKLAQFVVFPLQILESAHDLV